MSKKIEVLQYQKAVEALSKALLYAPHLKNSIEPAIDNCKVLIDRYNAEDYSIHNRTKKELGTIRSTLKKGVTANFKEKVLEDSERGYFLFDKTRELCEATVIPDHLIDSKIQISRRFPVSYLKSGTYEFELNAYLNTKLLECFLQQHADFIRENLI
jgi:hypothetical protein